MKSNVCDHFFLKGWSISCIINTVFNSQSFELCVSIKAVTYLLGNLISESFDQVD
jgi:hypothetical protein